MFNTYKYKMNCFIFAMKLWFSNHLRSSLVVKRSIGLKGMIFHFAHIKEKNNFIFIEDYIPKVRKDTLTDKGDSFVFFDGEYRTRIYELKAECTSGSLYSSRKKALVNQIVNSSSIINQITRSNIHEILNRPS